MSRTILEELVENDPGVAAALDAFCRSRLLENLARTSPLLNELPLANVKSTLAQFGSKRAKKGDQLLVEGEPAKGLFVVLAGELDVVHTSAIGPVRIKQLGPGDVFGEMSLLSGEPAAASVVAASDCTVLALDKVAFADFARANPSLETKLRKLAAARREHIAQFLPDETSSAVLV
jgi:CRP-like cAMP-binding protein